MNEATERAINDAAAALKAVALAKFNFNNAKAALEQAEAEVVQKEHKLRLAMTPFEEVPFKGGPLVWDPRPKSLIITPNAFQPGDTVPYEFVPGEQPPYPSPLSLDKQRKLVKESLDLEWKRYRNCRKHCKLAVGECPACTQVQNRIRDLEQKWASFKLPVALDGIPF